MGQMTEEYRNSILSEHNRLRRTINAVAMFELEYDADLECAARQYVERAKNGEWDGHNSARTANYKSCAVNDNRVPEFNSVGENWYSGNAAGAAHAWVDYEWGSVKCSEREALAANDDDTQALLPGQSIRNACAGQTYGHFSQVMSDNTRKVGCWYTQKYGTLCNYAPSGNFKGVKYATYGIACSACPSGTTCDDGLCATAVDLTKEIVQILPITYPDSRSNFDTGNEEDTGDTVKPDMNTWSKTTFTISSRLYPTFVSSLAQILGVAQESITVSGSVLENGSYTIVVLLDDVGQSAIFGLSQGQIAAMQPVGFQSFTNSDGSKTVELSEGSQVNNNLSVGAIIAATIGAILGVIGLVALTWYALRRKTTLKNQSFAKEAAEDAAKDI
ncbi:hypothetical protein SARC_07480 [Sphaeroforma arctica JP610]|uniref:SCP domain-containing protein n=1 Tax=Sphaeroforma arctica JP610 TaxID=667725 RepID=A0A0L0FW44_9EUKA|nr:hypothetical protein SARC_07480 [Sphaeroforma arctica JP610]KNC80153.1 hypothetical protein SARC_07480 [Sphaeroforma arctica JP610]|eukprot:XP_014154055.1 hypothetical protein SARC_07480 [Sphaeroforma arctica JP610]